ncbi:proline--tRNA ligase [Candidatus Aquarickettsia rohweri]|uniref:Proline--tRNA ligase n=2 Tax=Candidatus Aquarickettsia rohweri TaxID=2602574 RepID=A0A3R9ZKL9_9RICK|nr:proline--tRNA ligase [Candidatus Aquarickettsia rohweri]RST65720.1 proline--tRNA ligase [Candidatus Aquarickettsia rohweri]
MRLSNYLLPTTKDISSEAKLMSHKLMLKSGMIKQSSSGVYSWLPLGLSVLNKLSNLIRGELNKIHCHEIILPSLQLLSIWEKSGRAVEDSDMKSQIFHLKCQKQTDYVLPASGEEAVTELFKNSVNSYKDVGKILYQITWKFRDEIRPRHGVMRAKEFLMKDAYSFDVSKEKALISYEKIFKAYLRIFKKIGLKVIPVLAPTGAMGGNYSHEFHVLSAKNGESTIYYQEELIDYLEGDGFSLMGYEKFYAKEEEKHDLDDRKALKIVKSQSIEVGHLFYLGTKYSNSLNCKYQDSNGELQFAEMGCYGVGITRLIAAVIENCHDDKGIIWPDAISPFKLAIINIKTEDSLCRELSDKLYVNLSDKYDVLYDDTNKSPGKKFADMDLIGINLQIIIGPKHAASKKVELKNRKTGEVQLFDIPALESTIHEKFKSC